MGTKEVLIEARKLLEQPEHWTQGVFARNAKGRPVNMTAPDAVCFCISGAIGRASDKDSQRWQAALDFLCEKIRRKNIANFNDTHTHVEVLAALDKAIAAA